MLRDSTTAKPFGKDKNRGGRETLNARCLAGQSSYGVSGRRE